MSEEDQIGQFRKAFWCLLTKKGAKTITAVFKLIFLRGLLGNAEKELGCIVLIVKDHVLSVVSLQLLQQICVDSVFNLTLCCVVHLNSMICSRTSLLLFIWGYLTSDLVGNAQVLQIRLTIIVFFSGELVSK